MKTHTTYGINIHAGSNQFNDKPYFIICFVKSGFPSEHQRVTTASKKRLETLIAQWDKRVYFDSDGVTITAFNPNA